MATITTKMGGPYWEVICSPRKTWILYGLTWWLMIYNGIWCSEVILLDTITWYYQEVRRCPTLGDVSAIVVGDPMFNHRPIYSLYLHNLGVKSFELNQTKYWMWNHGTQEICFFFRSKFLISDIYFQIQVSNAFIYFSHVIWHSCLPNSCVSSRSMGNCPRFG